MRATPRHAPVHHDPLALPEHHFVQVWLLVAAFAVLALAVLHRRGLLELMFALDRSHVTQAVAALVLAGSAHALWHLLACSRRIERATALLHDARHVPADDGLVDAWHALGQPEDSVVDGGDLVDGRDDPLDHIAERLHGPTETGWFLVDSAVRLGLLGTIIGFILIFTSLSSVSIDGAEGLRELLVAMSGGMGTALLTTLAGLVGGTLLAVQYLILGRQADYLLGTLSRLRVRARSRPMPRHPPPRMARHPPHHPPGTLPGVRR